MKPRAILVSLALLAFAAPVQAMNWSLGTNLGLVVVAPTEDGADAVTLFGWPAQGFLTIIGAPGLRLGFIGESPHHQFYIDSGLSIISTEGANLTTVQFSGNYQYNFGRTSTQPYLTVGAGAVNFNSEDFFFNESATTAIFGAGLGVQHRLGHGHGTVRAEVRLDRVVEDEDGVIPESNNIGLKLGFDLWMGGDTPETE